MTALILTAIAIAIIAFSMGYCCSQRKIAKLHICKFNNACTHLDKTETFNAAKRVVELILANEEEALEYKNKLATYFREELKKLDAK